jgi:alanine racemase
LNNWIEISAPNLTSNFHAIQQAAQAEVLAVIKANAYGHGAATCAPILVRAGARWLGVTSAEEGARVRQALNQASLEADILVMSGFLPADLPLIAAHNLVPVVWTPAHIAALAGTSTRIHVEIDTGMGRQGIPVGPQLDQLLEKILHSNLIFDGLFTHLCSSEEANSPLTRLQQQRFESAVIAADAYVLYPKWLHLANTSAVDNPVQPADWLANLAVKFGARPMVRTGLALYGYALPIEGDAPPHLRPNLEPALTWLAAVIAVRTLAPGDTVGYNATFTARRPMRIATLAVGYADGLRRELSGRPAGNGGWVMIHNQPCPILGRISMNLTVVDITHLGEVTVGTPATILGPGITAEDHAALAQTIPYEILCAIHPCT